jgi:hypothetical protein
VSDPDLRERPGRVGIADGRRRDQLMRRRHAKHVDRLRAEDLLGEGLDRCVSSMNEDQP